MPAAKADGRGLHRQELDVSLQIALIVEDRYAISDPELVAAMTYRNDVEPGRSVTRISFDHDGLPLWRRRGGEHAPKTAHDASGYHWLLHLQPEEIAVPRKIRKRNAGDWSLPAVESR